MGEASCCKISFIHAPRRFLITSAIGSSINFLSVGRICISNCCEATKLRSRLISVAYVTSLGSLNLVPKVLSLPRESKVPWGPLLERPGNLTGPISYFQIKISRKVGCVLTYEVHFVSLADNFTVPFSKLLKLPSLVENKTV